MTNYCRRGFNIILFLIKLVLTIILVISATNGVLVDKLQGKYRRNDNENYHQVTIPKKISDNGEFVTHYLPHFYDTKRPKRHLAGESVNYLVAIDDRNHHIQLWPSTDFIAPGLVIEHHADSAKDNLSNIVIRQVRSNRCYFNGIVRGKPNSRAILSTCNGLAGVIKLGNGEVYQIEPVHEDDQPLLDEKQLHLIYKRSAEKGNPHNHTLTNCGTKGTYKEAINERLQWESLYGKAVENSIKNSIYERMIQSRQINDLQVEHKVEINRKSRKCTVCPDTSTPLCYCPPIDPVCVANIPLYLEVMVTIDHRIDRSWVGIDIETYILSILNVVSFNLADGSIGNPIRLNVVRLIILTFAYPQLDILRYSPMKLLDNFCQWQMNFNPNYENHPNHHDFAIFITRFEPCQGHVLGVTNMASICRPDKSCAVVSDEGLLLSSIITHQIGHSLGADHDDGSNGGCAAEEPDGTIYHMGPMMTMSSSEWSVCSKHCISDFVSTHVGWCLSDIPAVHDFIRPGVLPGQIYSPIQQCSINFNMKSMACRVGDFCKMLYCQISRTQCASTGDPPAPGTPCAMNMWCFHGDCVQRGARPGAVNGEWGPWSHWSPCTRSCGGGVQIRHRACNDPAPLHGGRICKGDFVTYKMCSIQPCVSFSQSFAQLQCKYTEQRTYKGRFHIWEHFQTFFEDAECTLICINEKQQIAIRSAVAVDGTPCNPGTRDVCVEGLCLPVGCDWVINSNSKEDACGTCHGNGTGCRTVQGYYSEANVSVGELQPILKLPIGTSMIYIRETNPTRCFLVITSSLNSSFYLNSLRGTETLPGLVYIAGTAGVYESKNNIERLYIQSNLRGPITVNLLCKDGKSRGVRYQYALPEQEPYYIPQYHWEFIYWEKCQRPCGGGAQRAKAVCVEARSGEVEDRYCSLSNKPDDVLRPCNQFPCTARWWVGPWSDCDCTDGEGIQTRLVLCLRTLGFDTTRTKVVKEKECCKQPKPRVEKPCSPKVDNDLLGQERKKRQLMEMLLPYSENTDSPNPDFHEKTQPEPNESNVSLRINNRNQENVNVSSRILKKKAYEADEDHYITPKNKIYSKNTDVNFPRRRKKMNSNNRGRIRLIDSPELPLDNKLSTNSVIQRRLAKPKLFNAIMEMANQMEKENPSVIKVTALKPPEAAPYTGHRSSVISKIEGKLVQPTSRLQNQRQFVPNNTLLAAKPVTASTTCKTNDMHNTTTECDETTPKRTYPSTETAAHTTVRSISTTTKLDSNSSSTWCPVKGVSPLHKIGEITTCSPERVTIYEPADLPGWLETANASSYKLIIAPIETPLPGYPGTDDEYRTFGSLGYWPISDEGNQLILFGEQVLKALLEAKRRATKPPAVDTDTD